MKNPGRTRLSRLMILCLTVLLCRTGGAHAEGFTETFGRGEVKLEVSASARRISPAADLEISMVLTFPEGQEVRLPENFADRLEGFSLEGSYEGESLTAGGMRHRTLHLRARPLPGAERYRLAPFAVRILDASASAAERWFPTRAILFEKGDILKPGESDPEGVETDLKPVWIAPSGRVVLRWLGVAAIAAGLVYLLLRLIRFVRLRIRLAKMAPRERALWELRELLARNLPEQGRAKEFYVALTAIVRRYIRRRHGIRAYEQTTWEFLRDAEKHPAFSEATLARLRDFLTAADMIKFAGVTASEETVRHSVETARNYLENDPAATGRAEEEAEA